MNDVDDDDILSEQEKEILEEHNVEMDGNIKYSKNIRGYEEDEPESIN